MDIEYSTLRNGFGMSEVEGDITFEILEGCEGEIDGCGICGGDDTTCVPLGDACGKCMADGANCYQ